MTFLFNTSFHIHDSAVAEFKRWASDEYIIAVKASDVFRSPVMLEVLTTAEAGEGMTYCIQMFSDKPEQAMSWLEDKLPELISPLMRRYGQEKILHFTSAMRVVEK